MDKPIDLPNIRIITISGRIGAGSTSLAKNLSSKLGWKHIEGGDIFWEGIRKRMNVSTKDTTLRPDEEDLLFEKRQKEILKNEKNIVLESKLAGFCAQGMGDILKIAVICEDESEQDRSEIRAGRLVDRERISIEEAKTEVMEREENDLNKWRRLYANGDKKWVYWDKKYYDLVVNTFAHDQRECLRLVSEKIGYKK